MECLWEIAWVLIQISHFFKTSNIVSNFSCWNESAWVRHEVITICWSGSRNILKTTYSVNFNGCWWALYNELRFCIETQTFLLRDNMSLVMFCNSILKRWSPSMSVDICRQSFEPRKNCVAFLTDSRNLTQMLCRCRSRNGIFLEFLNLTSVVFRLISQTDLTLKTLFSSYYHISKSDLFHDEISSVRAHYDGDLNEMINRLSKLLHSSPKLCNTMSCPLLLKSPKIG